MNTQPSIYNCCWEVISFISLSCGRPLSTCHVIYLITEEFRPMVDSFLPISCREFRFKFPVYVVFAMKSKGVDVPLSNLKFAQNVFVGEVMTG